MAGFYAATTQRPYATAPWPTISPPHTGHGVNLPVVVTALHGSVAMAVLAMKEGAVDFLERPFDERHLIAAIEGALAEPLDATSDCKAGAAAQQLAVLKLAVLTSRERQILDAIVVGHLNKVIAHNLAISMRTVEVHRARILDRLGLRSIAEAIRLSVLASMVPAASGDDERS